MTTDVHSRHRNRWLIASVALIGTWAGTLGNSMMPVALPSILRSFNVDLATGVWVISIYILLVAVLMPIFGWIGDRHGYRRTYLFGLAGYGVFCLAAPFAPSFGWLVAFRAMQAVFNATTLPAVMGIMSDVFPKNERGSAMGFWAAVNGAAHGSGPLLSGVMVQHLGWEAIFWFNGITALIGVVLIYFLVPSDRRSDKRPFDWLGMSLFCVAMLTFLITLSKGGRMGWGSSSTIGLFAGSIVCGLWFIWVEKRHAAPFMQLHHFAKRGYTTVVSIAGAQFFTLMGVQILLALYLIQLRGFASGFSGLLIAPLAATLASISPLAGKINDRFGPRIAMTCGMALVGAAALSMLFWDLEVRRPWQWSSRWWLPGSVWDSPSRRPPRRSRSPCPRKNWAWPSASST